MENIRNQIMRNFSSALSRSKDAIIGEALSEKLGFEPSMSFLILNQEKFTCIITVDKIETFCYDGNPFIEIHPYEFEMKENILNTTFKYRKL